MAVFMLIAMCVFFALAVPVAVSIGLANLVALVQRYFGLTYETWGKDAFGGAYPWLVRSPR